jgi:ABC-type protease/lipase transport system fused ATPase/permease subunit
VTHEAEREDIVKYAQSARQELEDRVNEYRRTLKDLSFRISKQRSSEDVQRRHVELAAEAIAPPDKSTRLLSDIGLLVAGGGVGYLGNVAIGKDFTVVNVLIFMIAIAAGACMYSYTLGRGKS